MYSCIYEYVKCKKDFFKIFTLIWLVLGFSMLAEGHPFFLMITVFFLSYKLESFYSFMHLYDLLLYWVCHWKTFVLLLIVYTIVFGIEHWSKKSGLNCSARPRDFYSMCPFSFPFWHVSALFPFLWRWNFY